MTIIARVARPAPPHDAVRCARPVRARRGTSQVHDARPSAAETARRPFCRAPPLYRTVSEQRALAGATKTSTVTGFPCTTRCAPPTNMTACARPLAAPAKPAAASRSVKANGRRRLAVVAFMCRAACRGATPYFAPARGSLYPSDEGSPALRAARALVSDDLDQPAPVAFAIELDEEHALPGAEAELAVADRDGFTCRSEQHRHAVGVTVTDRHVLGADVLCALVPVVVRVVGLARHEPLQQLGEVLEEPMLELVHPDAARGVRRVDAGDALRDAALADGFDHLLGDVPYSEPTCGS